MHSPTRFLAVGALLALAACSDTTVTEFEAPGPGPSFALADVISLGGSAFADENLSVNRNQSCQTCHHPAEGFATSPLGSDLAPDGAAIRGSVPGKMGARKPPTAAYATPTPSFTLSGGTSGGLFWDGRATGATLGSPAADQALGPFLNPVEQALPDKACVVHRVRFGTYAGTYVAAWGADINSIAFPENTETICGKHVGELETPSVPNEYVALSTADRARVNTAYANIAVSIAEFEATFNRFNSRADQGDLTPQEQEGLKLFGGKGKCQQCHSNKGARALFTDFRFHNLGVPRNPKNATFNYDVGAPFDPGLGGVTGRSADMGKFRTPTTRNVGMGSNRTYMHNGVLRNLKQVVDFYNTRDVLRTCTTAEIATLDPAEYGSYDPDGTGPLKAAGCWPPPEYPFNMDTKQMGKLGLTEAQVDAIVAYMRAMSDQ